MPPHTLRTRSPPLKPIIAVFFLVLQAEYFSTCHALLLKCPLYQMHLQKIVGFRPPLEYLSERNLIYSPASNYKDRNRFNKNEDGDYGYTVLPLKDHQATDPPVSAICWRTCKEDDDCIAYLHLLDTDECYGYSYLERTQRYMRIGSEMPLVSDAEAIFYEKTCLKVPEMCRNRLWTLTKIPGTSLVFQGKKTLSTLVTRRECAEYCLFESEFKCLSASFAPSHRNNRERINQHVPPHQQHITLGRCILSEKDKMIQPDAFRAAPFDEEYIENQCYEREAENDHCSYELYANSSFIYAEAKYVGLTQKECQTYCTQETRFYCQGVSFYYETDMTRSECALHSEDIISMGPRSLKLREYSVYMRRVKCLDVQVLCSRDEMAIKYTPKDWFHGKMYASQHSNDCIAQGNGTQSTLLRLQIGSEAKESRCGILRAYEVTKEYQRIFISALIFIQNNANVQTQGDRLIKVGCIMSNSTLQQHRDEVNIHDEKSEEEVPNAIALESSLAFKQNSLPNEGSFHFNISGPYQHPPPKITLQVIDLSRQHETNDVQIGQNLELQITAEYTPLQQQQVELTTHQLAPLPDFRATSLIAKTEDNQNYVLLIDERGCPTDVTVFPALERVRTPSRNMLRARFHAFKFAGTSMVNFDVQIRFCMRQLCPEENCVPYGGVANDERWQKSSKRRRRQPMAVNAAQQQELKIQNPVYLSTVDVVEQNEAAHERTTKLNLTESLNTYQRMITDLESETLPLNYNLHVRGPERANSNSFIYGERGILLIAGIDDHQDNFCLNQSLLIAILILWLILQIALIFGCCHIIQKYKRLATLEDERRKIYEEYLESRRVHWADQGGYTL